jgi:sugar O-acyltransferase (sialic acid O-acetyltransferase NeuD family)
VIKEVVVIGGGGHARVLVAVLHKLPWRIVGYTDARDRGDLLGTPYLGDDSMLPAVLAAHHRCCAAVGVGKIETSRWRSDLLQHIAALGFELPAVVSPDAVVNEHVRLGEGSVVFDGAVVNSGSDLGPGCIVNTHATVEHDCRAAENVHIASGATVCGGVSIGAHSVIGAGSTVIQSLSICAGCLVGAGAVVTGDLTAPGTYVGAPAERLP